MRAIDVCCLDVLRADTCHYMTGLRNALAYRSAAHRGRPCRADWFANEQDTL
jgi:hypothetical protein